MSDVIYDVENVTNTWDEDMLGKKWIMLEDGLTCLDCLGIEGVSSYELDLIQSNNKFWDSFWLENLIQKITF